MEKNGLASATPAGVVWKNGLVSATPAEVVWKNALASATPAEVVWKNALASATPAGVEDLAGGNTPGIVWKRQRTPAGVQEAWPASRHADVCKGDRITSCTPAGVRCLARELPGVAPPATILHPCWGG